MVYYRITIYVDGQPIEGKPVKKETVERTVSVFLENGFPEIFRVEKIEQNMRGQYTFQPNPT